MTNAERCKRYRERHPSEADKAESSLKRMKKGREQQKFMMRARLAKRDLDYAESPYAARVVVETRGNIVVETRGQRCVAPRITHLGNC